jgi:DNA repair protein RadC
MGIASWPERERPREKLLADGPQALSDAELLAIFLRTGIRGRSAVDLGRSLIDRFGSLSALFGADPASFGVVPGVGKAKYAQLQAGFELARRALREASARGDALSSPGAVRDYLRLTLESRAREAFVAVLLDAQNRVIAQEELFQGTLTQTSVYPREVVKCAMRHNAAAVIFAQSRDCLDQPVERKTLLH